MLYARVATLKMLTSMRIDRPINVLSLFGGMECGLIALKELGRPIGKYYSSEVNKFAIEQTKLNFPGVIHLGDINGWKDWDINFDEIDLILAGSPCQGFSVAGKKLAFDDPRSKLFFVFVDILKTVQSCNPDVRFMLENVKMKKEHLDIITSLVGVEPVMIDSALVSAQRRKRYYWTDIWTRAYGGMVYTEVAQPVDRGIVLKDILDGGLISEKHYLSESAHKRLKEQNDKLGSNVGMRVFSDRSEKASTILAVYPKRANISPYFIDSVPEKYYHSESMTKYIQSCIDKGKFKPSILNINDEKSGTIIRSYCKRGSQGPHFQDRYRLRMFTPTECARLQTIPSWYKWGCSETRQYEMLGNGWTVEVIKHILKEL